MIPENSPPSANSQSISSSALTSEDDISDQATPQKWQSSLYPDSINSRLNNILVRGCKHLESESKSDPKAAICELTLLCEKINVDIF